MNTFAKYATAAALAGALAVPAASPSLARGWHHHRAFGPGLGFGLAAGALVGAAAANAYAPDYYAPGYAYAPDYAYAPAYASVPAYASAYAYDPGVSVDPGISAYAYAPPRHSGWNGAVCTLSPSSINFKPCTGSK